MMGWILDVFDKGNTPVDQINAGDLVRGFCFAKNTDVYRAVLSRATQSCVAAYVIKGYKVPAIMGVWSGREWVAAHNMPGATLDGSPDIRTVLYIRKNAAGDGPNVWLVGDDPLLIRP